METSKVILIFLLLLGIIFFTLKGIDDIFYTNIYSAKILLKPECEYTWTKSTRQPYSIAQLKNGKYVIKDDTYEDYYLQFGLFFSKSVFSSIQSVTEFDDTCLAKAVIKREIDQNKPSIELK